MIDLSVIQVKAGLIVMVTLMTLIVVPIALEWLCLVTREYVTDDKIYHYRYRSVTIINRCLGYERVRGREDVRYDNVINKKGCLNDSDTRVLVAIVGSMILGLAFMFGQIALMLLALYAVLRMVRFIYRKRGNNK